MRRENRMKERETKERGETEREGKIGWSRERKGEREGKGRDRERRENRMKEKETK